MTLIIQKPTGSKLICAKSFTWNQTVWNPSMVQTALWLDAADSSTVTTVSGAVSAWNDKSTNSRHATQTTGIQRPTYLSNTLNRLPVVNFNGAAWMKTAQFSQSQPVSYFVVCCSSKATGGGGDRSYVFDGTSADSRQLFALFGNNSGFNSMFVTSWLQSSARISTNPILATCLFNGASSSITVDSTTQTGSFGLIAQGFGLTLGANFSQSLDFFSGYIAELVMIASASADVTQRTQGYLAHKWGLTANLPSNHPYKTVGPTP